MNSKIRQISRDKFPAPFLEMADPPKKLYIIGELPSTDSIYLTVVGSRKHTNYGKEVCEYLIEGLRGLPVTIVSGLALGIDSIAHRKALEVGLKTIAFPGSGLDDKVLYPSLNHGLAYKIVENGGALVSEFEPDFRATEWSFPQRNRLMAGLSKAVLVIEAEEKSGTLITARLALDYNRDVLAVPGSIYSPSSKGTNSLIRQGATPITSVKDLLEALGFAANHEREVINLQLFNDLSPEEKIVIELLREPRSRDELIREVNLPASKINAILSILEIKGLIKESGGLVRQNL